LAPERAALNLSTGEFQVRTPGTGLDTKALDIVVHTIAAQGSKAGFRKDVVPDARTLEVLRVSLEKLNVTCHWSEMGKCRNHGGHLEW